jgi:hypothetical protein
MNLIWIVIYICGYVVAWRAAFIIMLEKVCWGEVEPMDIIISCFFATLASIVYPLWLIPIALYRLLIKKNLEAWIERNYK